MDKLLAELEQRRIEEVARVEAELRAEMNAKHEEVHARIDATETTLISKIDDLTQALAEERAERKRALAEQAAFLVNQRKQDLMAAHVLHVATNARIDANVERIDAGEARVEGYMTELRMKDAEIQ